MKAFLGTISTGSGFAAFSVEGVAVPSVDTVESGDAVTEGLEPVPVRTGKSSSLELEGSVSEYMMPRSALGDLERPCEDLEVCLTERPA